LVQLLGQWGHGAVQGNKGNAVAALLSLCPFLPPFSVGLFHLCFGVDELKSLVLKRENQLWPRHVMGCSVAGSDSCSDEWLQDQYKFWRHFR
jgi:hypothetical protein